MKAGNAETLTRQGSSVRLMHWRSEAARFSQERSSPRVTWAARSWPTAQGEWALLSARWPNRTKPREIVEAAHGLRTGGCLEADAKTPLELLAASDLRPVRYRLGPRRRTVPVARRPAANRDPSRSISRRTAGDALAAIHENGSRIPGRRHAAAPTGLLLGRPHRPATLQHRYPAGHAALGRGVATNGGRDRTGQMGRVLLRHDAVSAEEAAHLARWSGPTQHPAPRLPESLAGEWLLLPEITVPDGPARNPCGKNRPRPRIRTAAIFYDVIPAKMPENYPDATLDFLRAYWRGWPTSTWCFRSPGPRQRTCGGWPRKVGAATDDVLCLWRARVEAPPATECARRLADLQPLRLLAVGTWEPRKNYPRLLRALAAAQARAGRPIHLIIVGRRAGYDELDAEMNGSLPKPVSPAGHVSDEELRELHPAAQATSSPRGRKASAFRSWRACGTAGRASAIRLRDCRARARRRRPPGGHARRSGHRRRAGAAGRQADLLSRLGQEAVTREIRSWDEYAEDIVRALSQVGSPPGWPLPNRPAPPLLTCAITTYNRAPWLRHSLPRLLDVTRPWRDVVEVVVCDNASTDDTPNRHRAIPRRAELRRSPQRGERRMLGNLGVTARASRGAYVWLLGDDDLLIDGAIENVLEGLAAHPEVEMAYMNYAYTHVDDRRWRRHRACACRRHADRRRRAETLRPQLREVAAAQREPVHSDLHLRVPPRPRVSRLQPDTRGDPFSSLATCVPSSVYALAALQDRPAGGSVSLRWW